MTSRITNKGRATASRAVYYIVVLLCTGIGLPAHADYLQTYVAAVCTGSGKAIVRFGYADASDPPAYPAVDPTQDDGLSNEAVTSPNLTEASCLLTDTREVRVRYEPDRGAKEILGSWTIWVGQIKIVQGDATQEYPGAVIIENNNFRVCRPDMTKISSPYDIPKFVAECDKFSPISGKPDLVEYPGQFVPAIEIDHNHNLCESAAHELALRYPLRDSRPALGPGQPFFGTSFEPGETPFHWVHWESDSSWVEHAQVDLNGTGRKQYVMRFTYEEAGGQGFSGNEAYVVTRQQLEYAKANLSQWGGFEQLANLTTYYPNAEPGDAANGQSAERHDLFEYRRAYYFYGTDHLDVTPISLYRLYANGRTKLQCVVRTIPSGS